MCIRDSFCSMQFVVESDGSVYPCDFYVLDEYKLGNLRDCSLADLSKSKILSGFLQGPRRSTKLCETCRYEMCIRDSLKPMQLEVKITDHNRNDPREERRNHTGPAKAAESHLELEIFD